MTKYVIDEDLYAKALEELKAKWRQKSPKLGEPLLQNSAKHTFATAWRYATQHHEQRKPKPTSPELPEVRNNPQVSAEGNARMRESMERFRTTITKNHSSAFEMMKANHRTALIHFFTMDNGLSQATAEEIVDNHILIH